jgi:hypothetical protein
VDAPKVLPAVADRLNITRSGWRNTLMTMPEAHRQPAKNTAFAVHFVIRGAEKRRSLAYGKAKRLQNELGVTPHLTSVK